MPSVATAPPGSKSGIITSETGERHIPSSVRPDGTKRKEIRIRPGYKPPEDVEVYKNRTAESWRSKGTGGIPGLETAEDISGDGKASSNKNAKRREARRKAKVSEDGNGEDGGVPLEGQGHDTETVPSHIKAIAKENWRESAPTGDKVVDEDAEKEKLARNLKKKLRQARELREKKDKGDSLLPEQFEKVIKINELIRQLDSLGFDADGEPKKG
jgi:partner of Y14 and mago protein